MIPESTPSPTEGKQVSAGETVSEQGLSPEELLRMTTPEGGEAIHTHGELQRVVRELASIFRVYGKYEGITMSEREYMQEELESEIARSQDRVNADKLEPFWRWIRNRAQYPASFRQTGERLSRLVDELNRDVSRKYPQGRREY